MQRRKAISDDCSFMFILKDAHCYMAYGSMI